VDEEYEGECAKEEVELWSKPNQGEPGAMPTRRAAPWVLYRILSRPTGSSHGSNSLVAGFGSASSRSRQRIVGTP
jgi:hypothetical protein